MNQVEFDHIFKTLCGTEVGAASEFARKIGTTPATISRLRSGTTPVSKRDAKLLRLIYYLASRRIGWQKISSKPVVARGIGDLL